MFAYDLLVVKAGSHGAATHLCECLLIESLMVWEAGAGRVGRDRYSLVRVFAY